MTSESGNPRPSISLLFRSLFWTILFPGTVTILLPFLIVTRWAGIRFPGWGVLQALALVPILVGGTVLLSCIWNFAAAGRGTLSPVDAPQKLVVVGLYRYVRNPMYVGVAMILLGEGLLFFSWVLAAYAAGWFLIVNLFIIVYEEPALRRDFGEAYERYYRSVGRWIPGSGYDDGI